LAPSGIFRLEDAVFPEMSEQFDISLGAGRVDRPFDFSLRNHRVPTCYCIAKDRRADLLREVWIASRLGVNSTNRRVVA
jgi:hypothetical protein